MSLILSNAFRRLGLSATASARDARRAIEEAIVRASLGGPSELDPEVLSSIRQTLDDPVSRVREELFWLHSPPEVVSPQIEPTDDAALSSAVERLKVTAGRGATTAQAIALHDLAVLLYAHDIDAGLAADETPALEYWAEVLASDAFWSYFAERVVGAGDPRLTEALVASLREQLPERVLTPVAARAATFLDAGDDARAAIAVRALRRSGMPETAIETAVRQACSPLRAQLEAGMEATEVACGSLTRSDGASAENLASFGRARSALVSAVLGPYERLRTVDPLGDRALEDRVADVVRSLSVNAYNVLHDWDAAYLLARVALGIASTSEALSRLARDQATAAKTYHHDRADQATTANRNDQAAAHFELAAEYADDVDERDRLLAIARGAAVHGNVRPGTVAQAKQSITAALDQQVTAFLSQAHEVSVDASDTPTTRSRKTVSAPTPRVKVQPKPPSRRRPKRRLAFAAVGGAVVLAAIAVWYSGENGTSSSVPAAARSQDATPDAGSAYQAVNSGALASSPSSTPRGTATSPACSRLRALDRALTGLHAKVGERRRAVRAIDTRNASVVARWEAFIKQHPEQYLSSGDYTTYVRLRRDVRTYQRNRLQLVQSANEAIDAYNAKLREYRAQAGMC